MVSMGFQGDLQLIFIVGKFKKKFSKHSWLSKIAKAVVLENTSNIAEILALRRSSISPI